MTHTYKLYAVLVTVCAVLLFACSALFAYANTGNTGEPGRFIVVFDKGAYTKQAEQDTLASSVGGKVALRLPFMNAIAIEVPEKAAEKMLAHRPGVARVFEDAEMSLARNPVSISKKPGTVVPVQPAEVIDWGVNIIDADEVWTRGYTGVGVNVAVLDTGIDADHPDLADNVKGGTGFIDTESWNVDSNGHGTHVSGTIAAVDNTIGVIGVAPKANLYGVQVLNRRGSGNLSMLLSGLNWAIENNMDVVSMSLSFILGTPLEQLGGTAEVVGSLAWTLERVNDAGIVVVAAAGNDGADGVSYPAAYPTVVAVAATDEQDLLASFSNYGSLVDVAAPGVNIKSTWKDGTYNWISGTSMATPHVAGLTALILGSNINMSNDEVRDRLTNSGTFVADPTNKEVDEDLLFSFTRIDAPTALGVVIP